MTQKNIIPHSLCWAAAIIASAIVGAPPLLSTLILPGLAAFSLLALGLRSESPGTKQAEANLLNPKK